MHYTAALEHAARWYSRPRPRSCAWAFRSGLFAAGSRPLPWAALPPLAILLGVGTVRHSRIHHYGRRGLGASPVLGNPVAVGRPAVGRCRAERDAAEACAPSATAVCSPFRATGGTSLWAPTGRLSPTRTARWCCVTRTARWSFRRNCPKSLCATFPTKRMGRRRKKTRQVPGSLARPKSRRPVLATADASGGKTIRPRDWFLATALVAAVFLVYQPVWQGRFIWDDDTHLLNNPVLRPGGCWAPGFPGRTSITGR